MWDWLGIWEKLNNAFTRLTEIVYPMMNDFKLMLYGANYNPFEVSSSLFHLLLFIYLMSVILFWLSFILWNINQLSNKQTIKKTLLLLLFVFIWIWMSLKMEEKNNLKPFNLSLVYIKGANDGSVEVIDKNKWYSHNESLDSKYNAKTLFSSENINKYLVLDIQEAFGIDNWLSSTYKDDKSFQKFIVWINPIYLPYNEVSVKDSYFSNLDLYNINHNKKEVDLKELKFTKTSFSNFLDILYLETDNKVKWKENIIPSTAERSSEKYKNAIMYKWKPFRFWGEYADPKYPYKSDLIFLYENDKDSKSPSTEYIVVPYFDIVRYFIPTLEENDFGIFALAQQKKKKEENVNAGKNEIPIEVKQWYTSIMSNLNKIKWIEVLKDPKLLDSTSNLTTDIKDGDNELKLANVDDVKLRYIMNFNISTKNSDIYDIENLKKYLYDYSEKNIEALKKLREIVKKYNKASIELQQTPNDETKINTVNIEKKNFELSKQKIVDKFKSITSREVFSTTVPEKTWILEVLNVVNKPVESDFTWLDLIWGETKIWNLITKLENLKVSLSQTDRYKLTRDEQLVFNVIESINKVIPEEYKSQILNKNNEVLYTLINFINLWNNLDISLNFDDILLTYVCKAGKINEDFEKRIESFWLKTSLDDIINCAGWKGKWEIIDKDKFKDLLSSIIQAELRANFISENVDIITLLWSVKEDNTLINKVYTAWSVNDLDQDFLINRVQFGKYQFVSPLMWYNALLNNKTRIINSIFINLEPIQWEVYTAKWVYNMKIWEVNSWYKDLDWVNGWNYAKALNFSPLPLVHHIVLLLIALFTLISYCSLFMFLYLVYHTLMNSVD